MELDRVNPGFVPQQVLTMGIDLNWSKYTTPQQLRSTANRLLERVQSQPGVLSAAVSSSFPLDPDSASGGGWTTGFQIEGNTQTEREAVRTASFRVATPDYFRTLGIPLVAGRTFQDSDNADAPAVAVLSQSIARHLWSGQDPIGRRLSFDRGETWVKIIGVVGDVKEFGLDREPPEQIYRPNAQRPAVGSILVRTSGDPMKLSQQVRRAILDIDPQTAITNVETLDQARAASVSSPRATARLFGLFAGLALVIAVTGLGCILALSVRQRIREIGIRVALGASPLDIVGRIVRQGMLLVILGLAIGLVGAVALTRFLKALLFQVTPTDPSTFVFISALLICATLVACYLPARRAARIDPQTALRCD
jgi:predicted permease